MKNEPSLLENIHTKAVVEKQKTPPLPATQPVMNANGPDDAMDLKPLSGTVIGAAAIALLAGVVLGYLAAKPSEPAHSQIVEKPEPKVESPDPNLVKVSDTQLKTIKVNEAAVHPFHSERVTTGKIAFNDDKVTPLFSPYTGRVLKIMAQPGDTVEKGAPLFEIDTPDLVQVESDLISAVSSLRRSQTALNLAKRNENIANRNMVSGKRKLELSRANETRQEALFKQQAVAKKDWEQSQRDSQQAEQDLEQANKDYEQAQSDIKSAESDIYANETILNAARDRLRVYGKTDAEIEKIEKERLIDRVTRVFSPISGTITQRKLGMGQYVKPDNPDPLFVITDLSTVWMLADVYESDVGLLKLGSDVEVSVMAFPNEVFKAKVSYISPAADPNTHRIAVRCVVNNPGQKLKAEMFASFRIFTGDSKSAPAVPTAAIIQEGDKKIVWVEGHSQNEFAKREISTGLEQNGFVQVLAGLKGEDKRIVSDGGLFLSNFQSAQ